MKKSSKASALIISLLILSIMLLVGLSVSITTVKEQKSAMESEKSSIAYQIAESGVEFTMQRLLDNSGLQIRNIPGFGECLNGGFTRNEGGGQNVIEFLEDDGDDVSCSRPASEVQVIKSSGSFRNVTRAIHAPVVFLP